MTTKKLYMIFLGSTILSSVYPIYMGIIMIVAHIRNGGINAIDYPKYIIPYTPICISLIICTLLLPLIYRHLKKFALITLSVLSIMLFLGTELGFERMVVFTDKLVVETSPDNNDDLKNVETAETIDDSVDTYDDIMTWQLYMCSIPSRDMEQYLQKQQEKAQQQQQVQEQQQEQPPQEQEITPQEPTVLTIKNPLLTQYSPVFKIHFYLISILIVLTVLGVFYGFYKMLHTKNYEKKKPLIVQLGAVVIFIGLCILACFTAFFRTGEIIVSPISAALMTVFFLVFGVTAGVYSGTLLYGKRKLLAFIIPSITAIIVAVAMYVGEMVMMNWNLYQLGTGFLFRPIPLIILSAFDIITILMAGAITFFILYAIRVKRCIVEG